MQPSGLIFLVIIAIWAAYLVQHWVRRREHLATARSVDRFSEAMRVLERRTPLPEATLSAPAPRSYFVSPARSPRPEVVVKRVQTSTPTRPVRDSAIRPTRTFQVLGRVSSRRLRGVSLLGSMLLVVAMASLTVVGIAPWWSAPAALVVLVADLVWLRHAAKVAAAYSKAPSAGKAKAYGSARARTLPWAAGRVASQVRREDAASATASKTSVGAAARHTLAGGSSAAADPRKPADARLGAGKPGIGRSSVAGDCAPAETAKTPEVATAEAVGWQPVPVPPPTYTLKAKAVRPERPAVDELDLDDTQEIPAVVLSSMFDGLVDDDELDDLLDRRRVAGA